jgi:dTDP-4-dehydrorhamnose reductase
MACVLRLTKVISENTPFILNWQNQLNEGKGAKVYAKKLLSPVSINKVTKAIAQNHGF